MFCSCNLSNNESHEKPSRGRRSSNWAWSSNYQIGQLINRNDLCSRPHPPPPSSVTWKVAEILNILRLSWNICENYLIWWDGPVLLKDTHITQSPPTRLKMTKICISYKRYWKRFCITKKVVSGFPRLTIGCLLCTVQQISKWTRKAASIQNYQKSCWKKSNMKLHQKKSYIWI